jgi:hypothetical protein
MQFDDKANTFIKRNDRCFCIYKLIPYVGDAAKVVIIKLVSGYDVGYSRSKNVIYPKHKIVYLSKPTKEMSPFC